MNGGRRIHNSRKRPKFTRWLTMAEVAELMGIKGEDAARDARSALLKAQLRAGEPIMRKFSPTQQGKWYTTEALIRRHAPELVETDVEATEAIRELRTAVLDRLDKLEAHAAELERETRRGFRSIDARLRAVEQSDTT